MLHFCLADRFVFGFFYPPSRPGVTVPLSPGGQGGFDLCWMQVNNNSFSFYHLLRNRKLFITDSYEIQPFPQGGEVNGMA